MSLTVVNYYNFLPLLISASQCNMKPSFCHLSFIHLFVYYSKHVQQHIPGEASLLLDHSACFALSFTDSTHSVT